MRKQKICYNFIICPNSITIFQENDLKAMLFRATKEKNRYFERVIKKSPLNFEATILTHMGANRKHATTFLFVLILSQYFRKMILILRSVVLRKKKIDILNE